MRKFIIIILIFSGCNSGSEMTHSVKTFDFDFEAGLEEWEAIFADYPVDDEEFYELESKHAPLPDPLDKSRKAFMISGNNHSDDLFMGIMRKVSGLALNNKYAVTYSLSFASNAPENSFGVGGSPGASVYLKAGAITKKPGRVPDQNNWYRLDIDKGNQASEGEDMINMGTIGIPGEDFVYTLIRRSNIDSPITAYTNQHGELWLILGTDSGFEATTTLYYDEISVTLKEVN